MALRCSGFIRTWEPVHRPANGTVARHRDRFLAPAGFRTVSALLLPLALLMALVGAASCSSEAKTGISLMGGAPVVSDTRGDSSETASTGEGFDFTSGGAGVGIDGQWALASWVSLNAFYFASTEIPYAPGRGLNVDRVQHTVTAVQARLWWSGIHVGAHAGWYTERLFNNYGRGQPDLKFDGQGRGDGGIIGFELNNGYLMHLRCDEADLRDNTDSNLKRHIEGCALAYGYRWK